MSAETKALKLPTTPGTPPRYNAAFRMGSYWHVLKSLAGHGPARVFASPEAAKAAAEKALVSHPLYRRA